MKKLLIVIFVGLYALGFTQNNSPAPLPDPPADFTPIGTDSPDKLAPGTRETSRMAVFAQEDISKLQNGTVFLGDSITEGFDVNKYFPGELVINRGIVGEGIGGYKRFGTINRLETTVYNLHPKRIIMMIGVNDTPGMSDDSTEKKFIQYDYLVWKIRHDLPNTELWCISLLPAGKKRTELNPKIRNFNVHIKEAVAKYNAHWLDVTAPLMDENHELKDELTHDGLHITSVGYDIVANLYKEYIFKTK